VLGVVAFGVVAFGVVAFGAVAFVAGCQRAPAIAPAPAFERPVASDANSAAVCAPPSAEKRSRLPRPGPLHN
jgi:hypothetical protein